MKTIKFNIACINRCTQAEGPGKRLAIWFQGCDKRCNGCCNPQLLDFSPVHILSQEELLTIVVDAKKEFDIEGVTFLGGEPTLQQGLAEFAQALRGIGLGVILFTGRQLEELSDSLKAAVDLIVDGEFEKDKTETERNLIGSTNQQIIFITDRYLLYKNWFFTPRPKRVEINIMDELFITGDII